jgi:two-component system, OmpR family, sensor histidine kinase CiaH
MKNILKQFAGRGTYFAQSEFEKAALKLALWHSLGIFVILTISSVLIITIYSSTGIRSSLQSMPEPEHSELSFYELQENLIEVVVVVDIVTLLVGMIFSYLDARRTLRPLEIMYQKQEQFMGDVAHELRTPLTVMKAGTEALLRQKRDTETYVGYLTDAHEEINRMTNMVNNLLFLLKHKEVGKSAKTSVDLGEIVARQVRTFLPYAELQKVTLTLNKDPNILVSGVSESLYRLVQNLLKNAIDYNVIGGKVAVTLNQVASNVVLTVADTGVGIDSVDQSKIFDRFYRGDQSRTATSQTGSGLGLSIVKTIIEEHQGTIDILSKKGEGTTILVTFPASKSS